MTWGEGEAHAFDFARESGELLCEAKYSEYTLLAYR
jgi:hypothetical protein